MDYRREIDGLRALAVLPVILFHAGFKVFSGGYVGVDVFFVISGYLITSIIVLEQQAGTFTLANFYERRARRILPALAVVVAATTLGAMALLRPGDMKEYAESVIAVFTFVSNILFWRTSGYFDTETELKPLLHTWSLAVEEQYYLFFPIVLMLAWRLGRRWIMSLLALVALASLALGQWGSYKDPTAAFYLLPTRGWELLIGALVAFHQANQPKASYRPVLRQAGSALGLALIVAAILVYDHETPFPGVYAMAPTLGAALIILFATPQTLVGRWLGSPAPVAIGLISYSTYLWHQPVLALARHHDASLAPGSPAMLALAILSLVLAYFSWRFVELPFRNKRLFSRQQIFSYGLAVSVGFMAFGVAGSLSTGFLFRYAPADRELASLHPAEAGKYVARRFNQLKKPFDPADTRRKVLLIGDSFGQDLVNALYEGKLVGRIQLATRHVSHHCGNLFIEQSVLLPKISRTELARCNGHGLYEDAALRRLMQDADEIWLASRWQPWQAELIQTSLANLRAFADKPVLVFGPKYVGTVDLKALLAADDSTRLAATGGELDHQLSRTRDMLSAALPADGWIDIQPLLCGNTHNTCPLFRQDFGLISYDGGHLTPAGARFLGQQLARLDLLKRLASP
jgi:peptidoglycan/LPS O-acetylase OafA/YrhL